MIHLLDFPYNGETRRDRLMEGKITDNKTHLYVTFETITAQCKIHLVYSVRNHGGIPDINAEAFELEIGGLVNTPVKISLKDLQDPAKFPCVHILMF
jgi:sulfite oxidase